MAVAQTLKEIALEKAKKRPELVDYLTEEAPILALLKWIPATHGLWNVEEVLDEISGASFTDLGAPLPTMQAETQLRQTYVSLMGGEIEVSKDKAAQFGGAKQYFARRENAVFRQAGMPVQVVPVTTKEYGLSKAARPYNSRLCKDKLVENGFVPLPDWKDALSRYLKILQQG